MCHEGGHDVGVPRRLHALLAPQQRLVQRPAEARAQLQLQRQQPGWRGGHRQTAQHTWATQEEGQEDGEGEEEGE